MTCVTSRCQSLYSLHHDEMSSNSLHSVPIAAQPSNQKSVIRPTMQQLASVCTLVNFVASGFLLPTYCRPSVATLSHYSHQECYAPLHSSSILPISAINCFQNHRRHLIMHFILRRPRQHSPDAFMSATTRTQHLVSLSVSPSL